jgi:hypothetical protein
MDTAIARPELLLVADAVAREKNIDREEVLEAMEQAIQKAGRAKYGHEKDIRATIDRKSGDVRLSRWTEIVDTVVPHGPQAAAVHRGMNAARVRRLPRQTKIAIHVPVSQVALGIEAANRVARNGGELRLSFGRALQRGLQYLLFPRTLRW